MADKEELKAIEYFKKYIEHIDTLLTCKKSTISIFDKREIDI